MDRKTARKKVKRFAELVRTRLPVCDVLLYGSYAHGRPHKDSDIDVAVVVDEYRGNLLDMNAELFRLRHHIDLLIEPVLLERKHDPAGFIEHIVATGKLIASYPTRKLLRKKCVRT